MVTGAGNIPCKHIIHTSGSNYDSSNASNSEKVAMFVCVHVANAHDYYSTCFRC